MNVRCILVDTNGTPSVIYCPGRSDIEMNRKIRSVFHFYPHVFLTRALDYKSDVWHGKIDCGEYNKISMDLLGKAIRGPLLILTRNEGDDISSQKYLDTDWERITTFLSSQIQGAPQLTTIQRQQPKQEQWKQRIHTDVPSLNTISSNTLMGSSASVQKKASVGVLPQQQQQLVFPEPTTRAYSGEGAFTYKPTPVEKKPPPPNVSVNITSSGGGGKHQLHVTVRDPDAPAGWYDDDDDSVQITPEEPVATPIQEEEEEVAPPDWEYLQKKVPPMYKRKHEVSEQQQKPERRSSRIAAKKKKTKY